MKIAIYGLGAETERVLPRLKGKYDVLGLLDGVMESGEMFGEPIISLDYAISSRVDRIIVVARPGSCRAIVNRIRRKCEESKVEIFDIRGNDLLEDRKVKFCFDSVSEMKRCELEMEISKADVVSFDLFDTLIMRRCYGIETMFELVAYKLFDNPKDIEKFVQKRIGVEKELSRVSVPCLRDIYSEMIRDGCVCGKSVDELVELEFSIDKMLLIPRREMVRLFEKTAQIKEVFLVSDSYYSFDQLEEIMRGCEIDVKVGLLDSCEEGVSKTKGLFQVLLERASSEKILHIGDDRYADGDCAQHAGIKSALIYSGEELFEKLGGMGVESHTNTISDKIKLGMLITTLFNNPFQFEKEKGKVTLDKSKAVGYALCGPILSDFTIWFSDMVQKENCDNVWLSARDGYLLKRLLEVIDHKNAVYFFTSRFAAIRAGIQSVDDIEYVESMHFSGSKKDNLKSRFGICVDDEPDSIFDYSNEIIELATVKRKNYKKYISKMKLKKGEIVFFDFVAKGTTQFFLNRLINNRLLGLYFIRLEPNSMKDKNLLIKSFYAQEEEENSELFNDYYIMETILTAPHPTVIDFDENGEPIFDVEKRTKAEIECLLEIQDGIVEYFKDYQKLCSHLPTNINKKFDENVFGLIHDIDIDNSIFSHFHVEDPFFNRNTGLDVLL